jgi:hypothetical protein
LRINGDFACEVSGARFEKSKQRRVSIEAGVNGKLEMVGGIVSGRIWRKTARWTMLETLGHRQNNHPARSSQPAVIEYPGQVGQNAWIFAPITIKNLTNLVSHTAPSSCS